MLVSVKVVSVRLLPPFKYYTTGTSTCHISMVLSFHVGVVTSLQPMLMSDEQKVHLAIISPGSNDHSRMISTLFELIPIP